MTINPYEAPQVSESRRAARASSFRHALGVYGILFLINVGIAMSFDEYFNCSKYLSNQLTDYYLQGDETPSFEGALVARGMIGWAVFFASFLIIPLLATLLFCWARSCYRSIVSRR